MGFLSDIKAGNLRGVIRKLTDPLGSAVDHSKYIHCLKVDLRVLANVVVRTDIGNHVVVTREFSDKAGKLGAFRTFIYTCNGHLRLQRLDKTKKDAVATHDEFVSKIRPKNKRTNS